MAKEYLNKLTQLIVNLKINDETDVELKTRHFLVVQRFMQTR